MIKNKEIKSYYEREAEFYKDHQKSIYFNVNPWKRYPHERRMRMVNDSLYNAINLLDVGCAEGLYFEGREIECVGIDLAKGYVSKAKKKYGNAHFIVADTCNLPFKEYIFNYVLCSEVLEHIPNWRSGISQLARVGENIIITVPLLNIWTGLAAFVRGNKKLPFDKPGKGHLRCFRYNELLKHLRAAKLVIEEVRGVSWFPVYEMARFRFPRALLKLIEILDDGLSRFTSLNFLSMTILVIAKAKHGRDND